MKKKILQLCLLATLTICSTLVGAELTQAQTYGVGYGWYQYRGAHLGAASGCAAGEVQMTAVLFENGSLTPITNPNGVSLQYAIVAPAPSYGLTVTPWYNYAAGVPSICVHHDAFVGLRITNTASSLYQNGRANIVHPLIATMRDLERNQHIQLNYHVKRKTDSPASTITALTPNNQIINSNPTYRFTLNELPGLYGANQVHSASQWITDLISWNTQLFKDIPLSGGVGTHTTPARNLPDGYYDWNISVDMNGTRSFLSSNYDNTPGTSLFYEYVPFLLDRVNPNSAVPSHVLNGTTTSGADYTISLNVSDSLSGLAETRLFLTNEDTGSASQIPYTFTVGSGITGGPKSQQTVDMNVTLPFSTNYSYYFVTTDAAGNTSQTAIQTFTTPAGPVTSPQCSDGINNDPLEDTLIDYDDPGCHVDGNPGSDPTCVGTTPDCSYNPNDDDEADPPVPTPQCSDGINNDPAEDSLIDHNDPGCHVDGNPGSDPTCVGTTPDCSYNPNDDDEADPPVTSPPTATISANPTLIRPGQTTTIDWDVTPDTDVSNCSITGIGPVGVSGPQQSNPINSQQTFTLTCDHPSGTITASVTVTVVPITEET